MEESETPFTQLLPKGRSWEVPEFCAKTKKQEVEPYMSIYTELVGILDSVTPNQENDDWGEWTPSPVHDRLSDITFRVGQQAYQEVDNPLYDEVQCLAWKKENMMHWTKVEWGTSDLVDTNYG
jgi:hypothetical protein